MKIEAIVAIHATHTSGKPVTVNAGKVSDIENKQAKGLVKDGYAKKAHKNATETALPPKAGPQAAPAPQTTTSASQTTTSARDVKAERAARTREALLGPDVKDADKNVDPPREREDDSNSTPDLDDSNS